MAEKVRWGVLGAANIAVKKVIPAMQAGENCEITALASRDRATAEQTARQLNIPKFYASYEELLADPDIEAVYIPLPNNLHVEWSVKAAEAGKHVLCEKPLALNVKEIQKLIEVRDRTGVKIQEAFMVRSHPTWLAVRQLIGAGRIGRVRAITGFFSYFNLDLKNIRNRPETGGGALLDIGCYCINAARFIFAGEPRKVAGMIERDPATGIDRLTSAMLDFPGGQAVFTCSTQLVPYQRLNFFGTKGRIEVPIPFNIPVDAPTEILIDDGSDLSGRNIEKIEFPAADQYTIQGELMSKAIRENTAPAVSLEDSLGNMAAIDAVFRSAETGNWEKPV